MLEPWLLSVLHQENRQRKTNSFFRRESSTCDAGPAFASCPPLWPIHHAEAEPIAKRRLCLRRWWHFLRLSRPESSNERCMAFKWHVTNLVLANMAIECLRFLRFWSRWVDFEGNFVGPASKAPFSLSSPYGPYLNNPLYPYPFPHSLFRSFSPTYLLLAYYGCFKVNLKCSSGGSVWLSHHHYFKKKLVTLKKCFSWFLSFLVLLSTSFSRDFRGSVFIECACCWNSLSIYPDD